MTCLAREGSAPIYTVGPTIGLAHLRTGSVSGSSNTSSHVMTRSRSRGGASDLARCWCAWQAIVVKAHFMGTNRAPRL